MQDFGGEVASGSDLLELTHLLYAAAVATPTSAAFVEEMGRLVRDFGFRLVCRDVTLPNARDLVIPADARSGSQAWRDAASGEKANRRPVVVADCVPGPDQGSALLLGLQSADDARAREAQDAARILSHVILAYRRSLQARVTEGAAWAVLERLPWGVIVVDHEGFILRANGRGERQLASGDGIGRKDGFIVAAGRDKDALARAIRTAATASRWTPEQSALRLMRSDKSLLPVLVLASRCDASLFHSSAAIVVTGDAGGEIAADEVIAKLFGLARAEAHILRAISIGTRLADSARERSTSLNTEKSLLQQIFRKLRKNRQTDLVRVVLSSPAALGGDNRRSEEGGED